MSLGTCVRSIGGLTLALAVALPLALHGGCGSNAGDPGTGGAGVGGGGMAGAGGSGNGGPEVPMSVCPKEPIKTLAGMGVKDSASQPALAWTDAGGGGFLVVWGANGGSAINGALVDAKGTRMGGGADIVIASNGRTLGSPELAPLPDAAEGFVVTYEDCDPATKTLPTPTCGVSTVLVGPDGQPKAAPVAIAQPAVVQRRPYVVTGHGKVYIAYRDLAGAKTVARVAILDAAGMQTGEGVLTDMESGQYPHLAVSDAATGKVAVVYQREKATTQDIVLALFNAELGEPAEVVIRSGIPGDATNPVVNWNSESWVVAWEDDRLQDDPRIYAAVVHGTTLAVGAQREAYDENGNWPTIATGGRNTSLIGFYGYPGQRVFLSRIHSRDGLRQGQVVLDTGKFPAVAYNPKSPNDEYAVVYENDMAKNIMFGTFTCASAM